MRAAERFRDLNGPEIHGLSVNVRFLFARGCHTLSRAPRFRRALDPEERFVYFLRGNIIPKHISYARSFHSSSTLHQFFYGRIFTSIQK